MTVCANFPYEITPVMSGNNQQQGCPECGSEADWGGASWCPDCGYYPAIKRQVAAPPSADEEEIYDHWWEVVPMWVWPIVAGTVVLFVVSLAVRLIFSENIIRTYWTIGQMGIGLIALGVVHFMAYLFAVGRSDKLGPLDMFMQPLQTWQPVFRELPESSNLVTTMALSVVAISFGFFVVDGVDYVAIMQADAEARKREMALQAAKDAAEGKKSSSPMGYVLQGASAMAQAKQAMNPDLAVAPPADLEDALTGFAGAAGVTGDGGLIEGGGGAGGMGGIGGAIAGLTGPGGVDVNAYMDQQKAIAAAGGVDPDAAGGGGFSMASMAGALTGGGTGEVELPEGTDVTIPGGNDSSKSWLDTAASGVTGDEGSESSKSRPAAKSTNRKIRLPSDDGSTEGGRTRQPSDGTSPVSTTVPGSSPSIPRTGDSGGGLSLTMPKEEVECVVLGYTTNASGELRSLLLAAAPDRKRLRFVGKLPIEQVDPAVLQSMIQRFPDIPARGPIVRCPYGGRWIRPEIFCMASYSGWTSEGRLNEAEIHSLVTHQAK